MRTALIAAIVLSIAVLAVSYAAQMDVGYADNGDFTRAMGVFTSGPIGFDVNWPDPVTQRDLWQRRFFKYYIPWWKLDYPEQMSIDRRFKSAAYVLWWPGVILNSLIYSSSVLNLSVMSIPARLLLLLAVALLLYWMCDHTSWHSIAATWLVGLGLAIILSSPYSYAMNSFYFEGAGLVFLMLYLLSMAIFAHWRSSIGILLPLIASFLVGSTKAQWAYFPLLSWFHIFVTSRLHGRKVILHRMVTLLGIAFLLNVIAWQLAMPSDEALINNLSFAHF